MKRHQIIIIILLAISTNIHGQAVRKYSNEFLKIGVGARYLGLGSSLSTSKGDPMSVFYNPAALATVEQTSIGAMHNSYFAGIANFDYAGLAIPIKNDQVIGFSLIRLGIDNIPNTIDLYNPDGTINYDNIKSFSISDMAGYISFAKSAARKEGLSFGGSAKIIHRNYGSFATAWGFGLDVGAQFISDNFQIGAFAQDISTTFSTWSFSFTDREKEVLRATNNEIPNSSSEITLPAIHFGGQYTYKIAKEKIHLTPIGKITLFTDQRNVLISGPVSVDLSLGLESKFLDVAYLRLGVNNFTKALNGLGEEYTSFVPSLGVGVKLDQFDIDYSYNNIANTGIGLYSHVFSGVYRFPTKVKKNSPIIMPPAPNIDPVLDKDFDTDIMKGTIAPKSSDPKKNAGDKK